MHKQIGAEKLFFIQRRKMVETLIDGLLSEIERCCQLRAEYDTILSGMFGAMAKAINKAKAVIASGDIREMIRSYKACQSCE